MKVVVELEPLSAILKWPVGVASTEMEQTQLQRTVASTICNVQQKLSMPPGRR